MSLDRMGTRKAAVLPEPEDSQYEVVLISAGRLPV
jgi:hypothetical protein